ncbi:hypothetical protein VTN96DRAFT_3651 [Rasamsonia emersonii]
MEDAGKNCVVFFGSQTGNAQDFAEKLAKEGHSRFGLETMVADLDDYDYETLVNFPDDKVAIFVLSSYGEGEPTDNAVGFYEFITDENPAFSEEKDRPLQAMRYAAFGLGNSTYEHFNAVVRKVDASLERLGARRVGSVGEGDDAKGTMEDDFLSWKDSMWESLCAVMNLHEQEARFEPTFAVSEQQAPAESVFLGERSKDELLGTRQTPHGPHHPFVARIVASQELFSAKDRNCLHIEMDIRDSGLSYQTGDHVAIWPMNADIEVDRFLRVFGILEKRHTTIHISTVDPTAHNSFPTPTTYDAAVRYYMEICGPISRQFLTTMAEFAADPKQKAALLKLGKDKDYFSEIISSKYLNLAQLIETISPDNPVCPIPFAVLIEGVRNLQPRYYSISSSSLIQKDSVAITAVVESVQFPQRWFKGVTTNYLLGLKQKQHGEQPQPHDLRYAISGPRDKYDLSLPIHIRHSSFKLPADVTRPIVMIGPGTGVAPFRAFIQERASQAQSGVKIGKMVLFFGCRKESEDFIYKTEWKAQKKALGDNFELYTAFSRQPAKKKVYVQHRLVEHAAELRSLLLDNNGYLYICGDARMAREVQSTLCELVSKELTISLSEGEAVIRKMKSTGRYQEDVW